MNKDDHLLPDALRGPQVPWWFGRGVGLALLALVVAVGWTVSWGVAAHVEAQPSLVAPRWDEPGSDILPVSDSSRDVPSPQAPPEASSSPRGRGDQGGLHGSDLEQPERGESGPTDQAMQAELLRDRQAERIEQAKRADQELAEFIQSVGVSDVLDAWVSPLDGDYRITATFGQGGSLWSNDHTGVDLAAASGSPVASVAAGTVTHAGDAGAYGLRVEVTHTDGTETSYSHLSDVVVTEGQLVQQGALVGAVGSTGNSTGPHLHLELTPSGGVPVDPVDALLARGVAL